MNQLYNNQKINFGAPKSWVRSALCTLHKTWHIIQPGLRRLPLLLPESGSPRLEGPLRRGHRRRCRLRGRIRHNHHRRRHCGERTNVNKHMKHCRRRSITTLYITIQGGTVQLDLTPEIEVIHVLFERCHTKKERDLVENDRNPNFCYLPNPNILLKPYYSAKCRISEYRIVPTQ